MAKRTVRQTGGCEYVMAVITNHPCFHHEVPGPDAAVWRYMDLGKFVSLISTKSLWFGRADCLGDPLEGSIPRANVEDRKTWGTNPPAWCAHSWPKTDVDFWTKFALRNEELVRSLCKSFVINCWHQNDHESAAMWGVYTRSNEGIAVRSTFGRLRSSLKLDRDIWLGAVNYIDYDADQISAQWIQEPFVHKRKSFEHEREIRAITYGCAGDRAGELDSSGIPIEVDLEELLCEVRVAPQAPGWFHSAVRDVGDRFGLKCPIEQSKLDVAPLY